MANYPAVLSLAADELCRPLSGESLPGESAESLQARRNWSHHIAHVLAAALPDERADAFLRDCGIAA
ncbi:hypothetical protein OOZ63_18040 [Paucibacter sp. PLA-PC-4]|uniref:hypothetical protein n=1 Tax=Paucibacter sp. PLA-PC-4 TaxID=2993655 RepID=UPI00224B0436|nr:hypothetical protein [Paucibacter sp. PLA-PC-4]MCX2863733.1 hypothetical protein [Paucibacter sp. PLA-PC-4]